MSSPQPATASAALGRPATGGSPTYAPPAPGQAPVRPGTTPRPAAASRPASRSRRTLSTPRTVVGLMAVAIAAVLLLGTVGTWQLVAAARASDAAADNTAQLIRIQDIQTALLHADAVATNGFLVGGLEPTDQRSDYDTAIADAASLIAAAAQAQPADREALEQLNVVVSDYVATMALARANNRLGFPVGAEYLRQASSSLRTEAIPILDNLTSANRERAVTEMQAHSATPLILAGLAALVLLVLVSIWLARLFHRVVNVGLSLALLLTLIALIMGGSGLTSRIASLDQIRTGTFADVTQLARATILGNDAKSFESLTLISRGSGQAYEEQWQAAADELSTILAGADPRVRAAWRAYTIAHEELRKLDDGGRWDEAVERSTGDGPANRAYHKFEQEARDALADASRRTTLDLDASRGGMIPIAVIMIVASLGAAVLACWGLSRRLREYQ